MDIEIKGVICSDDDVWYYEWFGETCTSPSIVRKLIKQASGDDLIVKINSGGGDVFSASEIYTELRNYPGKVRIQVQGLAASAASVIAMAGYCEISPTALMMVHNVSSYASGDYRVMEHERDALKTANKTIAAAYVAKTGMSEAEALEMMDQETWIDAQRAVSLKLADEVMFTDKHAWSITNFKKPAYSNSLVSVPDEVLNRIFKNNQPEEADFLVQHQKKKEIEAKLNLLKIGGKIYE
ncbi:head maturation protease, ClpP-related [Dielma fastidiosa]|uniref:ATP-dependent Clp protease proteolytic subunit n=1 Tax=Dielma fastidiosa TaxID=1034346 RepID=A0A318KSD2_9FIRM|nr:head maturation protease, ClpP-related [Dielma fastidiosa]PXX79738.1 ATP-dependent protease ClpP protease subunit [Dielma fastidiosa]